MATNTPTQAAQYRELAERVRTLVPTWNDPETRAELAWMAACYERLAYFTHVAVERRPLDDSEKPVH